jgi:hypothetical protein
MLRVFQIRICFEEGWDVIWCTVIGPKLQAFVALALAFGYHCFLGTSSKHHISSFNLKSITHFLVVMTTKMKTLFARSSAVRSKLCAAAHSAYVSFSQHN